MKIEDNQWKVMQQNFTRLFCITFLGPSWLYDDNDKKRRGKPKAPKSVAATSKKTNGSSDDSGDGTSTRVTRRSGGGSGVVQVDQPIQNCDDQTQNDQSSNPGRVLFQ